MRFPNLRQLELPIRLTSYRFKYTFIDLFAGIGGFRIPLEELGGNCRGYSEIDKEAIRIYRQNFISYLNQDEINLGDISKLNKLPNDLDIIAGGVPCQPWSVAGRLRGFDDPRGQLWFDVIRLVNQSQAKSFIFENVRGLVNPSNQENFNILLNKFENIGYCVQWKLINSYDFGLPQNRERVFFVGIRNDLENSQEYRFPDPLYVQPKVIDIIDEIKKIDAFEKAKLDVETLFGGTIPPSRTRFQKDDELNDFFIFSDLRNGHTTVHSWDIIRTSEREKLICLTLLKNRRRKKYGLKDGNPLSYENLAELIPKLKVCELEKLVSKNIFRKINNTYEFVNSKNMSGIHGVYRIVLPNSDIMPTLTATGAKDFIATESVYADNPDDYKQLFIKNIYRKKKYKPITAKHASRLQGFPDWFVFHEKEEIAKKQFGNAVSVPVVYHVAKQLLKTINIYE